MLDRETIKTLMLLPEVDMEKAKGQFSGEEPSNEKSAECAKAAFHALTIADENQQLQPSG